MRLPRCRLLSLAPPRAGARSPRAEPAQRCGSAAGLAPTARPRDPGGGCSGPSGAGAGPGAGSGHPRWARKVSRPGKSRAAPCQSTAGASGGGLGSCALGSCAQPPAEAPGGGGNRRGQRKIVAHKKNNQPASQLLEFACRRIWGRPGRAPLTCPETQSCAWPRGCGVWRGMCDSPGGLGLVVGCT